MFSSSEIVSWKKSSRIDFDLLSLRNFMLYLPQFSRGVLCMGKGTINDSDMESI